MLTSNANNSRHEFISYNSGVDGDNYSITVGFSRDPADESSLDGLILFRGRGIEDNSLGVAGVCVEIPIQRHVVYGGIIEARLRRDSFTLRFEDTTAQKMAGFREIVVHFDLSDEQFASIRAALQIIFTGCSCYRKEES